MIARLVTVAGLAAVLTMPMAAQQGAAATPAAPAGPTVGDMAPDFTVPGATKDGVMSKPFKLSDFRGKTVVLAFFPKARTNGCTIQMTHYRDEYTKIFNDGKEVVLVGISQDIPDTLAAWAKDASFPFRFASDADISVGKLYGTSDKPGYEKRWVYVISPDGKIAYTKKPFTPTVPDHYEELTAEIHKAMMMKGKAN